MKPTSVDELRKAGVPIIEFGDNIDDVVMDIVEILAESDRRNLLHAEEKLKEAKVILAVLILDWVPPYRDEGTKTATVIFSTHPRFTFGCRLDKGFARVAHDEGYRVILMKEEGGILPVEDYMA